MFPSRRSLILGAGAAIVTRRANALIAMRNPFIYPGGNPGFNPNHPAANGIRYAMAANYNSATITIAPGATGASGNYNSPTFKTQGLLGPSINITSGGVFTTAINEKPSSFTCSAIFYNTTTNATALLLNNNSGTNTNGVSIGLNGGVPVLFNNGTSIQPTFGQAASDYYFFAASTNGVTANWVLKLLRTGGQYALTFAAASTFSTPTFNQYLVGQAPAYLAACSYSINNFLSLPQLVAWAAAPWDFWYPPTQRNLMMSGLRSPAASGGSCPPGSLTGWGC